MSRPWISGEKCRQVRIGGVWQLLTKQLMPFVLAKNGLPTRVIYYGVDRQVKRAQDRRYQRQRERRYVWP